MRPRSNAPPSVCQTMPPWRFNPSSDCTNQRPRDLCAVIQAQAGKSNSAAILAKSTGRWWRVRKIAQQSSNYFTDFVKTGLETIMPA